MMHNAHSIKHTSICNDLKNEKQKTTTNCFLLFLYISPDSVSKTICLKNYLHVKKYLFTCREIITYV